MEQDLLQKKLKIDVKHIVLKVYNYFSISAKKTCTSKSKI